MVFDQYPISYEDYAKVSDLFQAFMTMPSQAKPDIHFRISKEDYAYIQATAKALDRSAAWLIADIVTKWVQSSRDHPIPDD